MERLTENISKEKFENLALMSNGVANNFNNILAVIHGYAELTITELPKDSPLRSYMEEILLATRYGSDITEKLLMCAGKNIGPFKEINLSELVREMTDMLQSSTPKKSTIQYEFAEDIPYIKGNEEQIKKMITNLVANACEAMEEDEGIITVRVGKIQCAECLYAYLEITDTGLGIDSDIKNKIFDPFFTTKFTGLGLGLSEVAGIMRMHQGLIKVYSELEYGTAVRLFFPISKKYFAVYGKTSKVKPFSDKDMILVIDDDRAVLKIVTAILERVGFQALPASSGSEALEMFGKHSDKIKVVLLDVVMPDMDGEETFYRLKNFCNDVKVIFASGYNEKVLSDKIIEEGAFGFIQKPYRAKDLIEIICKAINYSSMNLPGKMIFTEQYIG